MTQLGEIRQAIPDGHNDTMLDTEQRIWGASGGLGSYATQYALNGGAIPVCVVSSPEKAEICRKLGAELIIDRTAEGYRFWKDENNQNPKEWQRLGKKIRELTGGDDPDIVFEHPGRETFGALVYAARKGGVLALAPEEGLGVRNHELREKHLDGINAFRNV